MTQEILGLDLGSYSVKAVVLRKRLMGLEWVGGHQQVLPRVVPPFDWGKEPVPGLREWLAECHLPIHHVVVPVPAHLVSLRSVTLPFSDMRKIEKVVPFEVESLLPYSLEEVVVDYHVIERGGDKTRLLVAAAPRALIRKVLGNLAEAGIDPEAVELDGMALMNLAVQILNESGPPIDAEGGMVVLDIGATKTTVCVMHHGGAALLRSIRWGGQDVTSALRAGCEITAEEAEEWKRQTGLSDEIATRLREKGVSRIIRAAVEPFVDELIRTIHTHQAVSTERGANGGKSVKRFMLVGGGGKLRGLESHLVSRLGMDSVSATPKMVAGNGNPWDPVFAQGLGLALKATRLSGRSRMNFRRGEFAYGREVSVSTARLRFLWITALVVSALGFSDLYMKYSLQVDRYQTAKAAVRERFREMFPEARVIVDEVQQAKTAVGELRKRAEFFGEGDRTPLQLLAELTKRMPPSVKVEVQDLVIERARIRMEAKTDTFDSVDKIKTALAEFEVFNDVIISDAKATADQSHIRFRLTIHLAVKDPA